MRCLSVGGCKQGPQAQAADMGGELTSRWGPGGALLALYHSDSVNIVVFPKMCLSSQNHHPGWPSKRAQLRS